ncbi:protein NRT1/ PTR FAMILY 5.2-like [Iris pallida]|uniref:Protein NRT1/ PTR FAMILY 5.2-like n=1 Tax=Iris pallida TaxID=29817 RepID=A0AAX6F252_IRIPA|nr:protein NRT1/ PTR FAMILY 5.2-like [Iris pallida]
MARVIVAAVRKCRVPVPSDPKELQELDLEVYREKGRFRIDSTSTLRFLNKAAVSVGTDTPWMLSPVTQVEETKQILRLIPIQVAMFVPCTMIAQINTLFVKQGTTLDRHIGPRFEIPCSLPRGVRDDNHARLDRPLRPLLREAHEGPDEEPPGDHAPPEDRSGDGSARGDDGDGVPGREEKAGPSPEATGWCRAEARFRRPSSYCSRSSCSWGWPTPSWWWGARSSSTTRRRRA